MRVCKDWNKQISAESGFRFCWQQLQATIACGTDSWQLGVCLSSSAWEQQSRCWCHQCHHGGCQRHSCHLSHGMDHLKPYSPECWTRNYLSALLMCYFATVSLKHSFSFVSNISASSRSISHHSQEVLHLKLLRTQQTSAPCCQGVLFYIQESSICLAHMWSLCTAGSWSHMSVRPAPSCFWISHCSVINGCTTAFLCISYKAA